MTKLKQPLLSLEAHGTLGGILTYSKITPGDIVRSKPIPTDPRTLLQMYQRWTYQFFIAYWMSLTIAQKAAYRTQATRRHITPLAAFMRERLRSLKPITGWWRLDEPGGNLCRDSSPSEQNGTAYGTSSPPARVSLGRYFDGIDDYINLGSSTLYRPTTSFTVSYFVRTDEQATADYHITNQNGVTNGWGIYRANNSLDLRWRINGLTPAVATLGLVTLHTIEPRALVYDQVAGEVRCYLDGALIKTTPVTGLPIPSTLNLILARDAGSPAHYLKGILDDVFYFDEALPLLCIQQLHGRRYPL